MEHEHKIIRGNDWYIVRGEKGVVVIMIMPFIEGRAHRWGEVSIHSKTPLWGNHKTFGKCEWLNGSECYCTCLTVMRAESIIALRVDSDAFWRALENIYTSEFNSRATR